MPKAAKITAKWEFDSSSMISGRLRSSTRLAGRAISTTKGTTVCATRAPTKKRKVVMEIDPRVATSNALTGNLSEDADSTMPGHAASATLLSLERDTMGESWFRFLRDEFEKSYFQDLKNFLISEHRSHIVYPAMKDIYAWSRHTPFDSVKAVIIGQDPYHGVGQAHGLCFSVPPTVAVPPSLRNIHKQIAADDPSFVIPASGDLTPLARSGVLLLNTVLTVRKQAPLSHAKRGWETFTAEVIRALATRRPPAKETGGRGVVFFAWGLPAQKLCEEIGIDESIHLVLRSTHPSPLSAYRGFFGNGHFKLANDWLQERYGKGYEIDWSVLSSETPRIDR